MPGTEVLEDLPTRMRRAREVVKDREAAYKLAMAQWRALVVEGIDAGMSQQEVARISGVAKGRIHAVLVSSQPDEE